MQDAPNNWWANFLATGPTSAQGDDLNVVEQQANTRLTEAVQQHSVQTDQLAAATRREFWQPQAPPEQYLAIITNMQQWLIYFASFDAVAERLRAAGRPAFADRLKAVKEDSERALGICKEMAQAAGVHQANVLEITAAANRETTDTILRMNRDTQKVYDAANAKWLENFKGRR